MCGCGGIWAREGLQEGEGSEGVSKEEVAPGRVCTEEKTQLGAEAPQGDVCAVRYVRSVYQHITDMSGGFFYGW